MDFGNAWPDRAPAQPSAGASVPDVCHLRQKRPWIGGDLQTLAHRIVFRRHPIPGPSRSLKFPMMDGTGDVMTGTLHDPGQGKPLVVLMHGVTGCEDSVYLWDTALHLVRQGWTVLRLNHRGAGSSLAWCSRTYHCMGTADVAAVLNLLPGKLVDQGVFLVGFSMGGTILLNLLASQIRLPGILGAMTISAPLDLVASADRLHHPRNFIYQKSLLHSLMRMEVAMRKNGTLSPDTPLPRPNSLRGYDDEITAPRHGFSDGMDYYRQSSPVQRLMDISTPVTMLHAKDDPWIPADDYHRLLSRGGGPLQVVLTPRGGHVGFHFQGQSRPLFTTILAQRLKDAWPSGQGRTPDGS
ncbi:alpha/beta fold hydrolase [Rhodobacteraceae bacterium M382]|nr:alpha/beta fold hydrolase [Rhodobacteraceae bacterium M382]